MTAGDVQKCRDRVRNLLGSALEDKASDAFCIAFAHPSGALPGGPRVVVELAPEPLPAVPLDTAVAAMRTALSWSEVLAGPLAAVAGLLDERALRTLLPLLNPTALLREAYVRDLRERSYRAAAPLREALERGASARLAPLGGAFPHTQYCWLNQTIRTWANPLVLAELAVDRQFMRVDLPRPLSPEMEVSAAAIGAVHYREQTGCTGKGVAVAVVDFEVASHPAFQDRVTPMGNFTTEGWGNPHPHGTEMAGIIAARPEKEGDKKHTGIAPEAKIYNYKVMSLAGERGEDFDAACALAKALEDGARIANCSWRTDAPTDGTSREARACDQAWGCGMTVVKSAGNNGDGAGTITSPADAKGVIAVGAADRRMQVVQTYSSRGPTEDGRPRPHLVAPGGTDLGMIVTCDVLDGFGPTKPGTSQAAAHVSGVLALMLQAEPDLTPDEQRKQLLNLCTPDPQLDENTQGRGFLSLGRSWGRLC